MQRIINTLYKTTYGKFYEQPAGYERFNDDWYISPHGDLKDSRTGYNIDSDVLDNDGWLLHLMQKRWFDANTFLPAYFEACRRHGLKNITIRVE